MTLLFIPLIPLLLVGLGSITVAGTVWYSRLSPEDKEKENDDLAGRMGLGKKDDKKKLS